MNQNRPFEPRSLSPELTGKLDDFLAQHDFPCLYRSYSWESRSCGWEKDTYQDGFPSILRLEMQLSGETEHITPYDTHSAGFLDIIRQFSGKTERISLYDIKSVKQWGCPKGTSRQSIENTYIKEESFFQELGERLSDVSLIERDPGNPAGVLAESVSGVGPTYAGKVLRFVLPAQYGAIDSRQVRVFGEDNLSNNPHQWLPLRAMERRTGWEIESTDEHGWHRGYGIWIDILRYLGLKLREKDIKCPHPPRFVDEGLRDSGVWTCADVEMALFAYATCIINQKRH